MSKHKIVVGLGFGDEGKGTIVDHLTNVDDYDFVVRFSGGPQAAHNVITNDDRHHTFAQFGSGTFNEVPTILTRHMLVNPFNMAKEAQSLAEKVDFDPFTKLLISENSLLITPWHVAINQLEEIRRGEARHGSCGQGIGVAQKFALDYPDLALRVKDMLLDRDSFVAKATMVRALLAAEYGRPDKVAAHRMGGYVRMDFDRTPGNLQAMYSFFMKDCTPIIVTDEEITELIADSNCVWEGSQGALLDEWRGFHPYTTWSTTTAHTAMHMLNDAGVNTEDDVEVIGVTRTYHTRHGAGPFPSEDGGLLGDYPEPHNGTGVFQGAWRVGAWDLSLLQYGIDVNERVDSLAITHCDTERKFSTYSTPRFRLSNMAGNLEKQEKITKALLSIDRPWRQEHLDSLALYKSVSDEMGVPIRILSYGPKAEDKLQIDNDFWSVVQ
jgi:adenylosuccinate synthase